MTRQVSSRGRKALFILLVVALVLCAVEFGARGIHRLAFGGGYDPDNPFRDDEENGLGNLPGNLLPNWVERNHILHPYLGYVMDRGNKTAARHGLVTNHPPIQKRRDDTLLVGLFGGSVAFELRHRFEAVLVDRLAVLGDPRQVQVINVSLPGHKQPQQLMALTYLVFLGAEFDVVVNLDGFNEISLAASGNYDGGIYPFFPDAWHLRIGLPPGSAWLRQIEDIEQARARLERLMQRFKVSPLRASAVYGTWVGYRRQQLIGRIIDGNVRLVEESRPEGFEQTGPFRPYESRRALFDDMVDKWVEASLLMHAMVEQHGAAYHHFLQPNQYAEGSKSLSARELDRAYRPQAERAVDAARGYPLLRAAGRRLVARGVPFHDAVMVFAATEETLYRDICCHLNERGQQLLCEFMVDHIVGEAPG